MKIPCILTLVALLGGLAHGDSSIEPSAKYAYGANTGWVNFEGDDTHGVVVGAAWLSGFAWSANCGWIDFGDGSPSDGLAYSNRSASDYGVNHDGAGNLTGNAYGANIGWITFEQTHGQPRIDLVTGAFSGFAWSANCGWINLGAGYLATNTIVPGPDSDNDMIPDSWEYEQGAAHGTPSDLALLSKTGDADGDGVKDLDEYHADSDPFDPFDLFRVTEVEVDGDQHVFLEWSSSDRRLYDVQQSPDLVSAFADLAGQQDLPGLANSTSTDFTTPQAGTSFFKVRAKIPLAP